MKKCLGCKKILSENNFYASLKQCKKCNSEDAKRWYLKNKEKHILYVRSWQKNNPEKYRIIHRRSKKTKRGRFSRYKYDAKKRNLLWDLTFEEFMAFWQKPCYYCGDKIETIGLDRADNKEGYSINNIVPCCRSCNLFKRQIKKEAFIKICKAVAQHLG